MLLSDYDLSLLAIVLPVLVSHIMPEQQQQTSSNTDGNRSRYVQIYMQHGMPVANEPWTI